MTTFVLMLVTVFSSNMLQPGTRVVGDRLNGRLEKGQVDGTNLTRTNED